MSTPCRINSLIIGCGYLGTRLATILLKQNHQVFGTTRSVKNARVLSEIGIKPLIAEVTDADSLEPLHSVFESAPTDVYYLIPPGRQSTTNDPEAVIRDGIGNTAEIINHRSVRCAVLASSTAVYGPTDNDCVDADTEPVAHNDRAKRLINGEQQWLQRVAKSKIVRLAGLYGPGRVIGQGRLCSNKPIEGNPNAYLNLIHVDDAAELLFAISKPGHTSQKELGCDDQPYTRSDYYRWLANRLGAQHPIFLSPHATSRRSTSKICSNRITCLRTGWQPKYPSFKQGLHKILDEKYRLGP